MQADDDLMIRCNWGVRPSDGPIKQCTATLFIRQPGSRFILKRRTILLICGATGYEELREQVADRQVRSAEAKALHKQRLQLRVRQGRLLLLQTKGEHEAAKRQKRIEELEPAPASDQGDRQLARLRQVQTRWQGTRQERQKQIDSLSQDLAQLDEKAQTAQKTESRLERLIEEKMVRMEPNNKRLMDNLRVIARNAFYAALAPFKKAYNNYRDDHDQFRQLTQASGVLEVRSEQIVVHLLPRASYSPQLQRIQLRRSLLRRSRMKATYTNPSDFARILSPVGPDGTQFHSPDFRSDSQLRTRCTFWLRAAFRLLQGS
jgi:hypothetical protein